MKQDYTPPSMAYLGKVQDLTKQLFNKIGAASDTQTPLQPQIVGSLTPFP